MNQTPDDLAEQAFDGIKIQHFGVVLTPSDQVGADKDIAGTTSGIYVFLYIIAQ